MTNIKYRIMQRVKSFKAVILFLMVGILGTLASCSDDPAAENYYTFKGQMMSEYLQSHQEFSDFVEILNRAKMMDLLSAYGTYTCFAPTNSAIETYLKTKGKSSVDDLTDADCDTLARTHLVNNMYTTAEMGNGVLPTANMNKRYLQISHGFDKDSNAVVIVNKKANVIFTLQDDSVENGIMQPVDVVLESSTQMLPDIMALNPRIHLFNEALYETGLKDSLYKYKDPKYNSDDYEIYYYHSHTHYETAKVPDDHLFGFTAFVETDSFLQAKYNITTIEQLYNRACTIYYAVYPEYKNARYHSIDSLKNRKNPLNRYIAYHILDRNAQWNYMTNFDNITIYTNLVNPCEWYTTLCPYEMIKVEKVTVNKYVGSDEKGGIYLNRRYDSNNFIRGVHVFETIEDKYEQNAVNGVYYYVEDMDEDPLSFSLKTRAIVFNCRMRMDMATIFPELMTNNNIRGNGKYTEEDPKYDITGKYGRNYYFPQGFLANVKCNGIFLYRRPHSTYDCYEGDEFNAFGNYDITFRLPPVPSDGDYQIRLGFTAESTRGVAQVYFDNVPRGIPLDMKKSLSDASIEGSSFSKTWSSLSAEEQNEERKSLKNKGYYRGPTSCYASSSYGTTVFVNAPENVRIVLCTVNIKANEFHTLRIRNVSSSGSSEFMLDYIELVPKSVYGITDEGQVEDDL